MVTFGDPWGQKSTLDSAMDDAFGAGSWNDLSSPTGTSFLTGESFVYLEGGDTTADEMEAFINSNAAALTSWVNAGGSLFINAAPNEGDGLSFGVFDLVYPGDYCNLGCDAVDPLNPIFDGAGHIIWRQFVLAWVCGRRHVPDYQHGHRRFRAVGSVDGQRFPDDGVHDDHELPQR